MRALRTVGIVAGVALACAAFAACAPATEATVTPTVPLHTPGQDAVAPSGDSGSGEPAQPAGEPTCAGIISTVTVDDLTKVGWKAREDPFYVGNIELPGGIQCTWGDPEVPSDRVQVFGWALLDADLASQVKKELLDSGWKELDEGDVTYLTATGDMVMNPDDDGYGITYRLSDGQIAVADTKQGLLLIQWPPR